MTTEAAPSPVGSIPSSHSAAGGGRRGWGVGYRGGGLGGGVQGWGNGGWGTRVGYTGGVQGWGDGQGYGWGLRGR